MPFLEFCLNKETNLTETTYLHHIDVIKITNVAVV